MNIGFDAKRYFHNTTGLGNYSRDLIDGIMRLHPEHLYVLFDKKPKKARLPDCARIAEPTVSRLLWREWGVRREFRRQQLDIYHGLSNELPFGTWPSGVKSVVTIHDVIFRHFPGHYPIADRLIYERKTIHSLNRADAVIATSKATAEDLIKLYKGDRNKIHVVYQTCGAKHQLKYSPESVDNFRDSVQLPRDFILYVSSFQHRKNHLKLIEAFARTSNKDVFLVLCGRRGETSHAVEKLVNDLRLNNRVRIINDMSSDELPLLYRSARAFVYPSMTEGFGIPLLEAAHAGLPILVNDTPIFRELAPEGSAVANVNQVQAFAHELEKFYGMEKKEYGTYVNRFSTENQVEQLLTIYKDLLNR